jgi:osmotically-inducible protein OsmY
MKLEAVRNWSLIHIKAPWIQPPHNPRSKLRRKVMDNIQLRQDILDELDFEPSIDATRIGVTVSEGVVTLTGHVSSYAEEIRAEEAVRRIKGVHAIADEIEVQYPGWKATSDEDIAKRALNILEWNDVIPSDGVQVKVSKGWVTLSGEVAWQYQKKAAEDAVRKMTGVMGVINNISLKPSVLVKDVKERIESALRRHAEIEAGAIQISVRGGNKVVLEGKVDNWEERRAVENAAWSVPGVQSVDDQLSIVP